MLFVRICYSALKNVVMVEDEMKLGGMEGSELVSLYRSIEYEIDENSEGK